MTDRLVIRSRANTDIQRVGAAIAGRERGVLALEGERLIEDALRAKVEFELVLIAERLVERAEEFERRGLAVRVVDDDLLQRVSSLTKSPGLLALCRAPRERVVSDLKLAKDALLLVIAGIAEPGNLGALARSAEAAGASALCVVAGGASPWNDKAMRGSMGSLLRLPIVAFASADAAASELAARGFRHACAATRGGKSLSAFDWSGRIALWLGAETGSLPKACESFERVTIAMRGAVESLNVTVAGSLLLFAAGRAEEPRK
jgi:TrmH family RNA methyltransferase